MKKLLINKTKNNITVILLEENKIYGYLVLEKLIKYCKSENKAYFIPIDFVRANATCCSENMDIGAMY